MNLITKETLLTHLQRAEMASDVRLPIEFFRDLVYQAMPRTWVGLTDDDKVLIKYDANFNQFMTAGEYADRVQELTEARLKDKNNV